MMKRLQVLTEGIWEYVFCYDQRNKIITTKDYKKALQSRDLAFFRNRYGNNEFRVVNPKEVKP